MWDAEAVAAAIGEVAARDLERRVAIASFDARTLAHASAASEVVPRLLILKHVPDDVVRAAAEAGVRGILVDRKAVLARPEMVDDVHAAGVRIVVYTLNRDSQWDEVTALGVDGIVTDDPGTLSRWQQATAHARGLRPRRGHRRRSAARTRRIVEAESRPEVRHVAGSPPSSAACASSRVAAPLVASPLRSRRLPPEPAPGADAERAGDAVRDAETPASDADADRDEPAGRGLRAARAVRGHLLGRDARLAQGGEPAAERPRRHDALDAERRRRSSS